LPGRLVSSDTSMWRRDGMGWASPKQTLKPPLFVVAF